jgi:hypothetical protein
MLNLSLSAHGPLATKTLRQTRPKCCGAAVYSALPDGGTVIEHRWGGPRP